MISEIINDLKAHRRSYIDCNPIFASLAGGQITRFHYLAYLRETYHLIKHTPKYLNIAADRVAQSDERLSDYFHQFSLQETGHELLCIKDLNALGEHPEKILSGDPNPGVWGMVTQCYFWASHGNPVALLGEAFATEELGFTNGKDVATLLQTTYGIPREATNFLRLHGSEDKEHLEAAARAIVWYAGNRDVYADIVYATKTTYRYYGQLFTDVLELGTRWAKGLAVTASFYLYSLISAYQSTS
jgi:pyrroloquinoline quinone (PQQ) biosynthesis protein C